MQGDIKNIILDTAQELIQRRGMNAMSYNDISKEVGISKASIHHHFPSKEELINSLLIRFRKEFSAATAEILTATIKPSTKLKRFMALFECTLAEDKACLCGMLSAELFSLNDSTIKFVTAFLNDCQKTIIEILQEGEKDNSFIIKGNIGPLSDLFLATIEGGIFMSRVEGGPERFSKLLRQLEKTISP